jgi:tetratricopeptide (TPR) repeat protein
LLSAIVGLLLVLPAALAQGAVLAALPDLGTPAGADPARRTGSRLSVLLLGVLLAALLTPLVLVPSLGLRRTLSLAAVAALLAAVLFLGEMPVRPRARWAMAAAALAVMVLFGAFPAAWDPRIVAAGLYRYAAAAPDRFGSSARYLEERRKRGGPIFFREGREACVIVDATLESAPGIPDVETYVLSLDGRSAANDGADLRTQILTGAIPVLLHGPTESVLLVDYLTGETAASILRHPVRSLTVVEREPAVQKAGSLFIEDAESPLRDKRLRNVVDSPRARLLAEADLYDVIVLTATDPWLPHTAALITEEGYALLRQRLQPHGLLAQRLSLAAADEASLRTLLRTFARAFDSVTVFRLTVDDLLLIGSEGPLRLNAGWMSNVTSSNAAVASDLRRAVALSPNEILMALRLGGDGLRRLLGDGPLNDDDRSPVQVASVRNLAVHRNAGLVRAIDGAWNGFGPLLDNFGANPREQAAFLYNLAKSLLGLAADPDRALEVARHLAGMGEASSAGWVTGEALLQKRDIEGAVREWESVLARDPGHLDALFSLGTFYLDSNDYFEADRYLAQAARLHPGVAVARYHHGRALVHLSRHDQAIAELRKARELAGGGQAYPLVDYLVGLSAAKLGRHAEAAQALQDYLTWSYEHSSILTRVEVDAHLRLAEVFERQGKRFDAMRQRQKADQLRGRIEAYARSQQAGAGSAPEAVPEASLPNDGPAPPDGSAPLPGDPPAAAGPDAPQAPPGQPSPPQSDGR